MLRVVAVEGYRSLRRLVLPLAALTVVTGPNGSGKTSLYRALRLLVDTARGGAVAALAREGGLPSTLWAGPEVIGRAVREGRHPVQGTVRRGPVSVRLGFAGDDLGYAIDFGLPTARSTMFVQDPEIKREAVWSGPLLRPAALLTERSNAVVRTRDQDGRWVDAGRHVASTDSILSEVADARGAPEVLAVREQLRSWRFYDGFRTDADAPARRTHVGTFTPVLGAEGGDVAAALQTLRELEFGDAVDRAVDRAFPGSRVTVTAAEGLFALQVRQHGLLRPLGAAELSDGTLRYLLWVAALLTPRPPELFVLNEPETSLHPDLLTPLAQLIADAATRTQVLVVTHSEPLLAVLGAAAAGHRRLELTKDTGETRLVGQGQLDGPRWRWPDR